MAQLVFYARQVHLSEWQSLMPCLKAELRLPQKFQLGRCNWLKGKFFALGFKPHAMFEGWIEVTTKDHLEE